MGARSLLRPLAGMIVLAFLLPLAGFAESCDECLGGELPGCCPGACSLCLCCGPSFGAVSASPEVDHSPATCTWIASPVDSDVLSADPHDVFHVPKPF